MVFSEAWVCGGEKQVLGKLRSEKRCFWLGHVCLFCFCFVFPLCLHCLCLVCFDLFVCFPLFGLEGLGVPS